MVINSMPAGLFKGRCLRVMDQVRASRQPITITKRGRPIVKLIPADEEPRDILGCLAGTVEIAGEIEAPAAASSDWEAWR